MPLFAVIGLDHEPHAMDLRDRHRDEHRAYVTSNDSGIAFVGACLDEAGNQCGSLYIFEADSQEEVRDWLAREAFVRNGVYQHLVVRRFMLGKNTIPLQSWPKA